MRKLDIRLVALAGALLTTACFTPAEIEAQLAEAHEGDAHEGEAHEGEAHEGEAEAPVPEGIVNAQGKQLGVEVPEIKFEAPFDGEPLSSKTVADKVVVEEYLVGDGEVVVEGKQVEFSYTGYSTAHARAIMGSQLKPAKLVLNDAAREQSPISKALADGMSGMKVGGKRKITIPAALIEKDAPPNRPPMGDIVVTIEAMGVSEPFVPQPAAAYEGSPVRTQKLDNGLEIYDIVAGEGREAAEGDMVEAHYIGMLSDGKEFDSSHGRAEGMSAMAGGGGVIAGFSQGLVGVREGMLRKLVVPPELGYGAAAKGDRIPANSTLVFLLEITSVTEGKPLPPGMGAGGPPGARPGGRPGAGGPGAGAGGPGKGAGAGGPGKGPGAGGPGKGGKGPGAGGKGPGKGGPEGGERPPKPKAPEGDAG
ncbi:FKBP-type peptidyl-prolyl cis-trans isomerase [Pseudenhygromyxa sp. WMMC2535]|uniref:FKBP-type peptidyl-prolyl cis-trans isomerase n=1 Tax=Pseudenhygromyxa sp. WMMC2535 TaxID=2712867 RepID=UPI001551E0FB|nr:FKBP-type peptidyl-prolyl cis-trans isomerase [Pseudenhygromyxa sp. WMMC2535]NVB36195.1 FKBP-type peptidyl-prolyl cis-trans isomerase [Pseudenhygromyxa sp. WMMC2535]NVB43395.1 FKBP-type peptidyl-prolyl cis-trans isomerase [Pseudenhygromyxa sp. WMMC2535]